MLNFATEKQTKSTFSFKKNTSYMKKTVLFFCLLTLIACKEKHDELLLNSIEQAWQLCETSLKDAGARAEALRDSVRQSSEYTRQKYDLLTIRLRDKLDIVPSSPDSAKQTLSYFEGRKNAIDKERAYYYLGSAYRDLKDYPRAVSLFLKAADIAEQSKDADTLIWQNALSQLRNLYMLLLNYEEELNVANRSVALARQSGKNLECYLTDVASACQHLGDTMQSLSHLDEAYNIIRGKQSPAKYGRILASMLKAYSDFHHHDKVDSLLLMVCSLPADQRPKNYELCLAKCYEDKHLTDSAIAHYIIYNNMAKEPSGRYEAQAGLQRCFLQKGDYRQAALWGQHLYETNDTIIAQRAFEQTQRARDEYRYLRDKETERIIMQRAERIIFFSVIAGLALLIVVMSWVAFYFFRKKKFVEAIADKERLLEQKAKLNKELTRIALMNIATDKAEGVIAHFHNIASGKAQLTEGSWEGLVAAIETLYPGFLEAIQEREDKSVHEHLLHTICLLKIGMKPAQIAKVMDAKIQTVWNRVKRAEEICGDLITKR